MLFFGPVVFYLTRRNQGDMDIGWHTFVVTISTGRWRNELRSCSRHISSFQEHSAAGTDSTISHAFRSCISYWPNSTARRPYGALLAKAPEPIANAFNRIIFFTMSCSWSHLESYPMLCHLHKCLCINSCGTEFWNLHYREISLHLGLVSHWACSVHYAFPVWFWTSSNKVLL